MRYSLIISVLLLTGCTTEEVMLKNGHTGQVSRCGGDVAYAGVLYPFLVASKNDCVKSYQSQGFKVITSGS